MKVRNSRFIFCIICLVLFTCVAFVFLSGHHFVLRISSPYSDIRMIKLGRSWLQLSPRNIKEYISEAYNLPPVDPFASEPIHFTLHFPGAMGVPVMRVCYEDNFYFLIADTGSYNSLGFPHGDLSNMNDKQGTYVTWIQKGIPQKVIQFICYGADSGFSLLSSNDTTQIPTIAGVLGSYWMKKYDSIVFDYQKQMIYFNQSPISESSVPMTHAKTPKDWWIEFEADGFSGYGEIDTGCYSLIISKTFGKDIEPPKNLMQYLQSTTPIKHRFRFMKSVHDVKIGDFLLGNIKAMENDSHRITGQDTGLHVADFYSILGYGFWQNHIIQLDFKNQVFRIK